MSERVPSINRLLKEELSQIILRELDFPRNVLITLTRVETSSNLFQSKAYISVLPDSYFDTVFRVLKRNVFNIQQKLNKKLKIRPVPKIMFMQETKTQEAERIEEILENVKNK